MNIYQLLEAILEELADGRQEGESIADYKIRKAGELENRFHDKGEKVEKVRQSLEKKAVKAKGVHKDNPNMDTVTDWKDAQSKALDKQLEKSTLDNKEWKAHKIKTNAEHDKNVSALGKRKAKMNKNEALELMEEIINEVSVKRWKEAAANSLDARKEAAQNTAKYAEQSWDTYEEGSRKHPEEEDALYRRAWRDDIIAKKAEEKEDHAHDVLSVKAKGKSANKAIKAARASQDKRDKEYMQNSDPEKFNKLRVRTMKADQLVSADPVKSRAHEALELIEQIVDYADNLFELDYEEKQNISPNKISRVKKDKDGEKVEVVSVADELFPYSGSAKEQFNQKVLAKINDMIEGTGSLEDLIQFVRRGVAAKKNANEALEESKDPKGYKENMDIANHYDHLYSKEPANSPDGSPNPVAAEYKRKYQEYFDKAMKCHYGEDKKVSEAKDPVYSNIVSKELRGEKAIRDQHSDDVIKYADRADKATGYRKQINMERAADAEKAATEASKKFRQHKGEVLDYFRKKGDNNVEAHKKLSRMMGAYEGYEEAVNVLEEIINSSEPKKERKSNKQQVYRRMDDPEKGKIGVKKNYTRVIHNDSTSKDPAFDYVKIKGAKYRVDKYGQIGAPIEETLQEIKNVAEGLFKKDERGDLLDDIDTALGSPVKKTVKDIEERMTGAKQKKVSENLNDQIDKKLKKGEISLEKAFELDKKVEDNMSKEKNAQEYADELDKRAKKERLGDKAVAKSIRRNEKK